MASARKRSDSSHLGARATIISAVIASVTALAIAIAKYLVPEAASTVTPVSAADRITGRVLSAQDRRLIPNAKVTVDAAGLVPITRHSDSEGFFDIPLPKGIDRVRVRIERDGYEVYVGTSGRNGFATETEEFVLRPSKRGSQANANDRQAPVKAQVVPQVPVPVIEKAARSTLLDPALPLHDGPDAPWAVIVFGQQAQRHQDVNSWLRAALASSGRETISLFRKTSDEQREASRLFAGNRSLYAELNAGRHCSRLLVARLSMTSFDPLEGLAVAEATLSVHVLSPSGELLRQFELTEKGSGGNDEAAQRDAVSELRTVILRDLAGSIG